MPYLLDTDGDFGFRQVKIHELAYTSPTVAPPSQQEGLYEVSPEEFGEVGGFDFEIPVKVRTISQGSHEHLLEESLEKYNHIWRRLAQR